MSDTLYESMYNRFFELLIDESSIKTLQSLTEESIKLSKDTESDYVEIGPGNGEISKLFAGSFKSKTFIEPVSTYLENIKKLGFSNCQFFNGTFQEVDKSKLPKFDLLMLLNVIMYFDDKEVEELFEWIRNNKKSESARAIMMICCIQEKYQGMMMELIGYIFMNLGITTNFLQFTRTPNIPPKYIAICEKIGLKYETKTTEIIKKIDNSIDLSAIINWVLKEDILKYSLIAKEIGLPEDEINQVVYKSILKYCETKVEYPFVFGLDEFYLSI
jgi:succinate dehydrogenase flavin-adding protein (antitoxin of CptAB toxin-antitoxin module)